MKKPIRVWITPRLLAWPPMLQQYRFALCTPVSAWVLSWALLMASAASVAAEITLYDDWQRSVSLRPPAQRIVSLAPHLTELVYSAGAGERLVGVSRHCDFPPAVASLPQVSDHVTINYERVSQLQPDLILVWGAGLKETALHKLASLYKRVYVSDPDDFGSIAKNLTDLGALAATSTVAHTAADVFLADLARIQSDHARLPTVKTFYLIWHTPPMTIGDAHWISRALELCGGVNLFAHAIADVVQLNRESLQLARADRLLHSLDDYATPADSAALARALGLDLPAVYIDSDLIQRPSLRMVQGTAQLCRTLHGDHNSELD